MVYYKFYDETNKVDITDYRILNVKATSKYANTDTLTGFEIKNSTSISICYEISYENMISSNLDSKIERNKKIQNTAKSRLVVIHCIEEFPEMVFIEGGLLSKKGAKIKIEGFHADINEVSYKSYTDFCKVRNKVPPASDLLRNDRLNVPENIDYQEFYPILNVTWEEAKEYCESFGKRLPTVLEWEYMCQGGKADKALTQLEELHTGIYSFSELTPNAIELQGICSNAIEWCADSSKSNPQMKALKGFDSFLNYSKPELLKYHKSYLSTDSIGFRCVKSISQHEK